MPSFQGKPLDCAQQLQTDNGLWQVSQLQFFLHDIQFKDQQTNWQKTQIVSTPKTSDQVVLLGGYCAQSMNWTFKVKTTNTTKHQIKFTLGVPFEINHLNPLTQLHPLNQSDMFWTWQTGYKFLRLELNSEDNIEWIYHLGSTGCSSPSPVRAPKSPCKNPNRPSIELTDFAEGKTIMFEVDKLIADINLIEQSNCQSGDNNPTCKVLLPRTGIGAKQQIFSVQP